MKLETGKLGGLTRWRTVGTACILGLFHLLGSALLPGQEIDPNPVPGRFFVAPYGNDDWSGMLPEPNQGRSDGPYKTLQKAQQAARAAQVRATILVRQGTYHLGEPLVFEPQDSGAVWQAYPNERVVISGGVPVTDWKKGQGDVWVAQVPEVRARKHVFRQLRVGDEVQIPARFPNDDPANPLEGGWSHVVFEGQQQGAFGQAIRNIKSRGDSIEWRFQIARDGQYKVWFLYAAQNRQYGFTDLSGRMSIQFDAGVSIPLQNLRDSGSFRWSEVAETTLPQGDHIMKWSNDEGGVLVLDAIMLTDDPNFRPGARGARPAPGRQVVVIQAESFSSEDCQEIETPATRIPTFTDKFKFKFGDIKSYPRSPEPEIHIFPAGGEANTVVYPRRVDLRNRVAYLESGPNATLKIRPGNRFFVANVMEELDAPGEWFLDARSGTAYLWPRAADFQRQGVVGAVLDRIVEFRGNAKRNEWVQEITLKGFIFSDTVWSRQFTPMMAKDAAVWLSGARQCVIEGCRFLNVGGHAIRLEEKSNRNEIVGNHIGPVGQGGIVLMGTTETQPEDNLIAGNWMHDLGRVVKHVAGVYCVGASRTRIAHNLFENLPRYAISFKSPNPQTTSHNNTAEYNEIVNACLETANGAAIESYAPHKQDTGNVISYNRIADAVGRTTDSEGAFQTPHLAYGILLDAYSSGVTVRDNLVVRASGAALAVKGGSRNVIQNNILVNGASQQALFVPVDASAEGNQFLRNILYHNDPKAVFLGASGRWNPKFFANCDYNIYWHGLGLPFFSNANIRHTPLGSFGQWQKAGNGEHSQISEPGFVDPSSGNYNVGPESTAATKIEFEPLPLDKIGLSGFERSWDRD